VSIALSHSTVQVLEMRKRLLLFNYFSRCSSFNKNAITSRPSIIIELQDILKDVCEKIIERKNRSFKLYKTISDFTVKNFTTIFSTCFATFCAYQKISNTSITLKIFNETAMYQIGFHLKKANLLPTKTPFIDGVIAATTNNHLQLKLKNSEILTEEKK
jgi:hypothetical protein